LQRLVGRGLLSLLPVFFLFLISATLRFLPFFLVPAFWASNRAPVKVFRLPFVCPSDVEGARLFFHSTCLPRSGGSDSSYDLCRLPYESSFWGFFPLDFLTRISPRYRTVLFRFSYAVIVHFFLHLRYSSGAAFGLAFHLWFFAMLCLFSSPRPPRLSPFFDLRSTS